MVGIVLRIESYFMGSRFGPLFGVFQLGVCFSFLFGVSARGSQEFLLLGVWFGLYFFVFFCLFVFFFLFSPFSCWCWCCLIYLLLQEGCWVARVTHSLALLRLF